MNALATFDLTTAHPAGEAFIKEAALLPVNIDTLLEKLIDGMHVSGVIASKARANHWLMPRCRDNVRSALIATLFQNE